MGSLDGFPSVLNSSLTERVTQEVELVTPQLLQIGVYKEMVDAVIGKISVIELLDRQFNRRIRRELLWFGPCIELVI
jgi:hypothetical protein